MSPVANMMIHNPITALAGDAGELRKTATILDIMKDTIINAYVTKSHLSREEISALMDTTTYFTADQAIEKGFATEKIVFDIKNSEFSNLENFKIKPKQVINSGNTEKKGGESMGAKNMQELEAQNKELVEDIRKEAIAQERKRINDLDVLNEQTQGKCKDIIDEAKLSGKTRAEIVENVLAKFIENSANTEETEKVPEDKNPADILDIRRQESKKIEIDNRAPGQPDNTKDLIADIVNIANAE
jgi:ATP-dependent Clp protease, proteolytic subunit ClpP